MLKKYSTFIVLAILGWFFAVSLIVFSQESTTMDEQAHIPSAYTYVKYNDMRLNPEHPPLLKDLAGIPLLFLNVKFPTDDPAWMSGVNEQWNLGNKFIHQNNADAITFWSRVPILLVALLLGFFIFRWTKELAGTAAGLFALVLYAFDPNILGHNHYVTTDIGIAAFIFIAFYFFVKFVKNPNWKNTVLAGVFLALAELAKFSGVLLFPVFGIIAITYALAKKKPGFDQRSDSRFRWAKIWEYVGKYMLIIIICFAIIWIVYFYNTFNMPAEKVQDISKAVFSDSGMGIISKSIVIKMSAISFLKPLSEYFLGVFMVFVRVEGGNTYYFLGNVSNHASPAYFPVVFLIKETIPFLLLLLAAAGLAIFQTVKNIFSYPGNILAKIGGTIKFYLQTGVAYYTMLAFIALYVYLSITGNLNIGFRHLFPILPFAYVLVSKKVFDWIKSANSETTKKTFKIILAGLVIWIVLEPLIFFPSYLSYFNQLVGGPKNGYKYVTDSNADWGQDLKRLRNWVSDYNQSHPQDPISKIRIDYFGGSNPGYYFGNAFIPWHSGNNPEAGWYAISAGFLMENISKAKQPGEKSYEWLKSYSPYARAGDSIFIYYIPAK
ncbi:MAG: glycosyltransferase family 39 protein [Candidatus Moranbacteria bacterium]|nr:glycosyltransferase family 39 protein [Candidatus Moranbacteria bacterium]